MRRRLYLVYFTDIVLLSFFKTTFYLFFSSGRFAQPVQAEEAAAECHGSMIGASTLLAVEQMNATMAQKMNLHVALDGSLIIGSDGTSMAGGGGSSISGMRPMTSFDSHIHMTNMASPFKTSSSSMLNTPSSGATLTRRGKGGAGSSSSSSRNGSLGSSRHRIDANDDNDDKDMADPTSSAALLRTRSASEELYLKPSRQKSICQKIAEYFFSY